MARLMHYSVICFSIITAVITTSYLRYVHSETLASDVEVLRRLKEGIDPNTISSTSFLYTWDLNVDPCESSGGKFLGVICITLDNSTSRVTELDLEQGDYDGFLTESIGNLTELTILNLSKNRFRGPLPDSVSNLHKLTALSLSDNYFTGNVPDRIDQLKDLEILDLSNNRMSGSVPVTISGLRRLNQLRMSNNGFSGRIPNLSGLWHLTTLDLSNNQLYGTLPQLPLNLRTLLLSHNILSGHISPISTIGHLRIIDLSDNRFSGAISREIIVLPEVTKLNLSSNHLSTMDMTRISGIVTELQVLDLQDNRLRGHLPTSLVAYANLTSINLGNNLFSGRIPVEYGEKLAGSWRSLFLDHNYLVGNLPQQFSSIRGRIRGSLANNCLRCPDNIQLCHGGQRPASDCVGQNVKNG